jgi:hypothetical protein
MSNDTIKQPRVERKSIMEKDDKFNYRVERGETVTISFELQNLPSSAVSMGSPWTLVSGQGHPQYKYKIPKKNEPDGDLKLYHSVSEVSFVQPETGAQAEISVEGSKGGKFLVTTIKVTTRKKETEIKFSATD